MIDETTEVPELDTEAEKALARGELPEGEVQTSEANPPTVHIIVNRDGAQVSVDVVATGDVRVTEIESLIKLGLNKWQQQAGLG